MSWLRSKQIDIHNYVKFENVFYRGFLFKILELKPIIMNDKINFNIFDASYKNDICMQSMPN